MVNIIIALLMKLATEAFLARAAILILKQLSKSTENDLDDKIVEEVAKALGCGDLVK